jgi:hypothetical protein
MCLVVLDEESIFISGGLWASNPANHKYHVLYLITGMYCRYKLEDMFKDF